MRRRSPLCALPCLAAIGRDVNLADGAAARPRETAELVVAWTGEFLSASRKGDDRLRPNLIGQRHDFRILLKMAVVVVGHVVAIDDLDPAQIFRLIDAFEAGHDPPERGPLLRTHRLALL